MAEIQPDAQSQATIPLYDRRGSALAFLEILHPRCGKPANDNLLCQDIVRHIIDLAFPSVALDYITYRPSQRCLGINEVVCCFGTFGCEIAIYPHDFDIQVDDTATNTYARLIFRRSVGDKYVMPTIGRVKHMKCYMYSNPSCLKMLYFDPVTYQPIAMYEEITGPTMYRVEAYRLEAFHGDDIRYCCRQGRAGAQSAPARYDESYFFTPKIMRMDDAALRNVPRNFKSMLNVLPIIIPRLLALGARYATRR